MTAAAPAATRERRWSGTGGPLPRGTRPTGHARVDMPVIAEAGATQSAEKQIGHLTAPWHRPGEVLRCRGARRRCGCHRNRLLLVRVSLGRRARRRRPMGPPAAVLLCRPSRPPARRPCLSGRDAALRRARRAVVGRDHVQRVMAGRTPPLGSVDAPRVGRRSAARLAVGRGAMTPSPGEWGHPDRHRRSRSDESNLLGRRPCFLRQWRSHRLGPGGRPHRQSVRSPRRLLPLARSLVARSTPRQ